MILDRHLHMPFYFLKTFTEYPYICKTKYKTGGIIVHYKILKARLKNLFLYGFITERVMNSNPYLNKDLAFLFF